MIVPHCSSLHPSSQCLHSIHFAHTHAQTHREPAGGEHNTQTYTRTHANTYAHAGGGVISHKVPQLLQRTTGAKCTNIQTEREPQQQRSYTVFVYDYVGNVLSVPMLGWAPRKPAPLGRRLPTRNKFHYSEQLQLVHSAATQSASASARTSARSSIFCTSVSGLVCLCVCVCECTN